MSLPPSLASTSVSTWPPIARRWMMRTLTVAVAPSAIVTLAVPCAVASPLATSLRARVDEMAVESQPVSTIMARSVEPTVTLMV